MARGLLRDTLRPDLLHRVGAIWEVVGQFQTEGVDGLLIELCAEPNPEREVSLWELIARMFRKHEAERQTPYEKRELYSLLVGATTTSFHGPFQTIPTTEAIAIIEEMKEAWENPPQTDAGED